MAKTTKKKNAAASPVFESDAEKITNRHLADPNHVITEEEIRDIRIGMVPMLETPGPEAMDESDDRIADKKSDKEDGTMPGAQKLTSWDVIEPS